MNIDVTKPVKTRDGRKARYLGTLANEETYPLVFAVRDVAGNEHTVNRAISGKIYEGGTAHSDIVQAPVTVEKFLNVYPTGDAYSYDDGTEALGYVNDNGSTLRLTYEDDKLVSVDILPD